MEEDMKPRESIKELRIDEKVKQQFMNERNREVERHIESVKNWREKSAACLGIC